MSFETLGLSQPVLQALALKEYTQSTPIQEQAIPVLLQGRDLLGIAQTGTGKTAAFMLPSIDRLVASDKRPQRGTCRMLVLAPTRELASQIAESARAYGRFAHISVATVFGGTSINKNRQDVSRGVDVLVATPGRLLDLIDQRFLDLRQVEILVLDEADQMLDLGFIHDLKKIVKMLPAKRQSLFFSATMPSAIKDLADKFLTDPAQVSVAPASTTVERVDQYVTFVQQAEKQALLTMMLRSGFSDRGNMDRVLIFTRTKHGADRVVKLLAGNGIAPMRSTAIRASRSASVRSPSSRPARSRSWWRPTSRRAASTCRASATSSISSCRTYRSNMSTASGAPPGPARPASRSLIAPRTSGRTSRGSRSSPSSASKWCRCRRTSSARPTASSRAAPAPRFRSARSARAARLVPQSVTRHARRVAATAPARGRGATRRGGGLPPTPDRPSAKLLAMLPSPE
jgi:phosphopantetheine adenylyltransferase